MHKVVLVTGALLLFLTPIAPAFAHDDAYDYHAQDHREHYRYHQDVDEAHAVAHEDGFYSRREHRAYHRALGDLHEEFHEDHPSTYHDHWDGY